SKAMKAAKTVALEDHLFVSYDGQYGFLPEKGLSQQQATNRAHGILHNLATAEAMKVNGEPWLEILAPQLILYFVSKLVRMLHILRQLPPDLSWQVRSANGMLTSMARGILPDCVSTYRSFLSRRGLKDYIYYIFPRIMSHRRLIHLKRNENSEVFKARMKKGGVLCWCTNVVHETVACQIAESLVADNIPSFCVASRGLNLPFVIPQSILRDALWKRTVKKELPRVRSFLDDIAQSIIQDLVVKETGSSNTGMVKFLRSKLEVSFVPQAADAMALAQRALDLIEPRAVLIQDVGDFRTRALAWSAREKGIPVYHHQQGTATLEGIEWRWDIADKHLLWGDWSREVAIAHGLPPQKIHITGTPRINFSAESLERNHRPTNVTARALFTLMPASPLTFGNGGALNLSECQWVMKMLFRWVELMEGRVVLQIKPRPLGDHPWFDSFSLDLPSHVEILPNDLSVGDALKNTDIVVTTHSTVAIDAIMMYKPLVFIDWGYKPHPFTDAVQHGAAYIAGSPMELKTTVDNLLFNRSVLDEMVRNQTAYRKRVLAVTGTESTERISQILCRVPDEISIKNRNEINRNEIN
ncbi:hypothetical protein MYX82_09285, partial [Acidobacteria bacterium AH-259-D05]|nr:hypothetical protein [Acidobacteria bacterium AH-259-D05]